MPPHISPCCRKPRRNEFIWSFMVGFWMFPLSITMPTLKIKLPNSCQYDLLALGEIMLRLDPGESRVRTAREFKVWEGGGEYNVARGLRRCFGLRPAVCTAFADNDLATP